MVPSSRLPPNTKPVDSNYKGGLPSQKYFTPQELNSLARVGKQPLPRPPSAKKEALPKASQEMSSSGTSFHSEANRTIDQEQQEKLKKLAKPFGLAKSKQPLPSQAIPSSLLNGLTKPEDIDDMISELSSPQIDFAEQRRFLEQIGSKSKAKDKEEEDLESCFADLQKSSGIKAQEFDDLVSEYSQAQSQTSFYKPQLKSKPVTEPTKKPPSKPSLAPAKPTPAKVAPTPAKVSQALVRVKEETKAEVLFNADTGVNRLDHIYAQIKELQKMKEDIIDDLDDFMSEVNAPESNVKLPAQFDEVVDIVVNQQREASDNFVAICEGGSNEEILRAMQQMQQSEGNEFWTKFLQPQIEYEPIAAKVEAALNQIEKGQKMTLQDQNKLKEMNKIRKLDMQLASMAKKIQAKKINEMQQSHKEDDAVSVESKKGKRPQTVTEEKGDTFLTDMLFKNKMPQKPAKPTKPAAVKRAQSELKKPQDKKSDVDSEEYQDIVFDIDESKHLLQKADDYLENRQSTAWGEASEGKSNRHFINVNRMKAGEKIIINRACDRLDPVRRERLEEMVVEIERNLDDVMREKAEYFKQVNSLDTASKQSKLTQMSNAYSFVGDLKSAMDSIDNRIKQCNPDAQLIPITYEPSGLRHGFDQSSKIMNESQSNFSIPMSGMSRRSDFTTIVIPGISKNVKMPGDASLKEKAEQRMQQSKLMEIERSLMEIKTTDDLSYSKSDAQSNVSSHKTETGKQLIDKETLMRLIDGCREEEERLSVMTDHKSDSHLQICKQSEISQMQIEVYNRQDRRLKEAKLEIQAASRELMADRSDQFRMLEQQIKEAGKTDFRAMQNEIDSKSRLLEQELAHSAKHKQQLDLVLGDLNQLTETLDQRQAKLQQLQQQDRGEEQIERAALPLEEVEEEDPMDDEVLGPILRDIERFRLLEKELGQPSVVVAMDEGMVSSEFDYKEYAQALAD